jgi:N-acetylglucosamine kinase-like BadF-type ATPase
MAGSGIAKKMAPWRPRAAGPVTGVGTQRVAAVDGGGTKTAAALADARGEVTFLPAQAGCNPQDSPGWDGVLGAVLDELAARRGLVAAVLGMPGFGEVPELDEGVCALVAARLPVRAEVLNDVDLAFRGAFPQGRGVLVLAGTGSMAIAGAEGRIARAGGWGDLIGDEGSAYWIGAEALRRAAMEADGRAGATGFGERLMVALGVAGRPYAPLAYVMASRETRPAIAAVAMQVDGMAEAGDAQAAAILEAAAAHLAQAAQAAAGRAGLGAGGPWAHAGSAFRSATLRRGVGRALGAGPVPAAMTALGGGLWRAAQAAGWAVDERWQARVAAATAAWQ